MDQVDDLNFKEFVLFQIKIAKKRKEEVVKALKLYLSQYLCYVYELYTVRFVHHGLMELLFEIK